MVEEIGKSDLSAKEEQRILFCSQPSVHVLINAINKYEQAVQKYIDPEINNEETVLLVADIIDNLADSLPKYLQEDRGMRARIIDSITQIKEQDFQRQQDIKKQFVKLAYGIMSMSQKFFARHVSKSARLN